MVLWVKSEKGDGWMRFITEQLFVMIIIVIMVAFI
jgi:hypothetical protein